MLLFILPALALIILLISFSTRKIIYPVIAGKVDDDYASMHQEKLNMMARFWFSNGRSVNHYQYKIGAVRGDSVKPCKIKNGDMILFEPLTKSALGLSDNPIKTGDVLVLAIDNPGSKHHNQLKLRCYIGVDAERSEILTKTFNSESIARESRHPLESLRGRVRYFVPSVKGKNLAQEPNLILEEYNPDIGASILDVPTASTDVQTPSTCV